MLGRAWQLGGRQQEQLDPDAVPDRFRRAAVLALLACEAGVPVLVLTERAATLRAHASEICLPGGRMDPGETVEQAALREAGEELGIDGTTIEVLGVLDEAWSRAGNVVTPVVAWHHGPLPAMVPAVDEVARVFVLPVAALADPGNLTTRSIEAGGHLWVDDVLAVDECRVVGLTADLVRDLLAWLEGSDRRRAADRSENLRRFVALVEGDR